MKWYIWIGSTVLIAIILSALLIAVIEIDYKFNCEDGIMPEPTADAGATSERTQWCMQIRDAKVYRAEQGRKAIGIGNNNAN